MKYCNQCGAEVQHRIPDGDNLPRFVCDACNTIHYQNPKIVTGCIPEWEDKILLCRRAIDPRKGLWTLPAGFMENAETSSEGAARETLEEACAQVEVGNLFALFNIPHINQVYLLFRARLLSLDFSPGIESLEVDLFTESEIPWDELAFDVVKETLERYFKDRSSGTYTVQVDDIRPE